MDVVQRATLGGHVAQVNLLVLYLDLKESKSRKVRVRIHLHCTVTTDLCI